QESIPSTQLLQLLHTPISFPLEHRSRRRNEMTRTMAVAAAMMVTSLAYAERLASGLDFRTPNGWTVKSNDQAAILLPPDMATEPGSNEPSELYIVATLPGVKDLSDPQVASILRGSYFPAATQINSAGQAEAFRAANGMGVLHRLDALS